MEVRSLSISSGGSGLQTCRDAAVGDNGSGGVEYDRGDRQAEASATLASAAMATAATAEKVLVRI